MSKTNDYILAIETLEIYFDTPLKTTLKNMPDWEGIIKILTDKGANMIPERTAAVEKWKDNLSNTIKVIR
jgi:hypothetical protein